MKQITRLIALSIFILASISQMHAKIWIVNYVGQGDYTSFQAAHDAATAGDTIYVIGSPAVYDAGKGLTLSKQLIIIGPGYFLMQNSNLTVTTSTASVGTITINPAAAGTVIKGMEINGINCNSNNIAISRNHITSGINLGNAGFIVSNIVITQNFMDNSGIVDGVPGSLSILIANNIFNYGGSSLLSFWGAAVIVLNNIFDGNGSGTLDFESGGTLTFQNNILEGISSVYLTAGASVSNNVCEGTQLSAGNGNLLHVNMANVFVGSGSTDAQWQLKTGSPAIGAGVGGVDCGAFGGSSPYVLSGIPPIPQVYFLNAPFYGSNTSGLPITVKVRTNN